MTTIREHLNSGTLEGYRLAKKMLQASYGKVPLCCVEARGRRSYNGKRLTIWLKCSFLNKWLTTTAFKQKCLECQDEMVAIVMNQEL